MPAPTPAADPKSKGVPKELLRALRQIEILTSRLATDALAGAYTSVFRGQGIVFREVRPYQPGDDIRQIDWNVSARTGETFVKLFTEEREMTVMLLVDVSASQHFGTVRAPKGRLAAEIAALLAFSAIKGGDRVGLVMVSDRVERIVPPRKGEKHVLRVTREVLAGAQPWMRDDATAGEGHTEPTGRGTDLAAGIEALTRLAKRRSVAFVISDFFVGDGDARARARFERVLALAAAKHDVIAVELVDPRDDELPDVGLATLEDLETGDTRLVDTGEARVREAYARAARARRKSIRDTFKRLAIDAIVARTDGSYVKPIRDLFARRARRARSGR
ncbi:MAG: DUF58 domain-containing protein [Polyangiales bacterium]